MRRPLKLASISGGPAAPAVPLEEQPKGPQRVGRRAWGKAAGEAPVHMGLTAACGGLSPDPTGELRKGSVGNGSRANVPQMSTMGMELGSTRGRDTEERREAERDTETQRRGETDAGSPILGPLECGEEGWLP